MKKPFLYILCLLSAVLSCFSGCTPSGVSTAEPVVRVLEIQAGETEKSCLEFVLTELSSDGGVFTNYLSEETSGESASGHEVLSESQGLMLCYYAASYERDRYEKTLSFVQSRLDSGNIISYRLSEDGSRFSVNASVDDLRILRGLLEGGKVFSEPEYNEICNQYAERLYATNVEDNLLLDFYDENYSSNGRICTLCYSDLKTMQMLGQSDKRWLSVEKNMRAVILNGYLGDEFPFFRTRYLLDEGSYSTENIHMVEALLSALHLSEIGKCPKETVNWLHNALSDGAVYGEYTEKGEPSTTIESTAIYALCALLGVSENEPDIVREAIDKLCTFQIKDKQSSLYGAFGDADTGKAFSFDNLMALTALREQTEFFAAREKGDAN